MRRAPGTGSVWPQRAKNGVETWYGKWSSNGRQIKRALGPKRVVGSREGLTRVQAEAKLREFQAAVKPAGPASGRLDIAEVGRRYVTFLERKGRKRSTIVAVRSCLTIWLEPTFAGRALDRITTNDVDDLVSRMEAKGLSPKSIQNYVGTLSALFGFAMAPRRRWVSSNPCDGAELPRNGDEDAEIRFLELEQVDALVAHAVAGAYRDIDRALYRTAAMTGLRQGELIALRWCDVDWSASRIRVRQNHVLGEFGTPKSKRSSRSVPMADEVAGELERLFQASACQGDDELVFADPHRRGEPLHKPRILRRMRAALKAAGQPERRFHDLRHTFGTRCAAAGVPMRTLQEWMGHRDIKTTERYADYAPSTREAELVAVAFQRESVELPAPAPAPAGAIA